MRVRELSLTGKFDRLAKAGHVQYILPMNGLVCLCRVAGRLQLRGQTSFFIILGELGISQLGGHILR